MKFKGYYIKCTTSLGESIAIILGMADYPFIQIITKDKSYSLKTNWQFDFKQISLEFEKAKGEVSLDSFVRPRYHTMGPLRFLPFLECKHTVLSMFHNISGKLIIGGKEYNFKNGRGYIEGDYGKSFPERYFWTHSFLGKLGGNSSVFASAAIIPYLGVKHTGTVCIIYHNGREYRLASYLGARIVSFESNKLVVLQRHKILEISVQTPIQNNRELFAPTKGKMTRVITETVQTQVRYKFTIGGKTIFDLTDNNASFEFSGPY